MKAVMWANLLLLPTYNKNRDLTTGVCRLLGHRDLLISIYSLQSFFSSVHHSYPIYIINDGSLTLVDKLILNHFFYVIYTTETERTEKMEKTIKRYRYLYKFLTDARTTFFKKKFDSVLFSPFSKIIYLDSDILFLKESTEIISWINRDHKNNLYTIHSKECKKLFMKESQNEYTYRILLFKYMRYRIDSSINGGMLFFQSNPKMYLQKLNKIFSLLYKLGRANQELAEECAFSLLLQAIPSKHLSVTKYINVPYVEEYRRIKKDGIFQQANSVHYNNFPMKQYLYSDCFRLFLWPKRQKKGLL